MSPIPSATGVTDFPVIGQALLPNWRLALSNVANAASDARILFVGDSTTWGAYDATYPSNSTQSSWPILLSQLCNKFPGYNVSNASATPGQTTGGDSRVVLTGGFALSNVRAGFAHWCFAVSSTGTLTFTPGDGVSYDRFDVYTQGGGGGGVINAQATGGSSTPITQPYSNTILKTTITGTAGTSNNLALTWSSGEVEVVGIEAWSSTNIRVRFANVGFSGSATSQWSDSLTSLNAIQAWSPDLTFIMLGINDARSAVVPATYSSNLQTIITAATSVGDVVIMPPIPSDPTLVNVNALEGTYTSICAELARANGCVFLDLFNRFGGQFQPLLMQTDSPALHPNPAGYRDIARFVHSYIFC